MFSQFLNWYEYMMVATFGYEVAVHLEEVILALAIFALSTIILTYMFAKFMLRVQSITKCGDSRLQVTQLHDGDETKYIIKVGSTKEAFEYILILLFSPLFTIKRFGYKDEKRTRKFLVWVSVAVVIIFAFAILSICTMFRPI